MSNTQLGAGKRLFYDHICIRCRLSRSTLLLTVNPVLPREYVRTEEGSDHKARRLRVGADALYGD